ncbi:MobQ family relaxase [Thalassobacillus pellis]|uniref:MobQ family relaxase n=1 Tax=Thalassobacillus pellis TaxID=748008 RepID=UPI001961E268|nr:MobQ family relaxase [Thalassobacillus pellis]MBM7554561.1 ATP-dependent exoDNAse (exonuclease V) alpha subunit [Thalassobacillus pellis]
MAIYHFSVQMLSRSKGQSAVAAASYRSGERLREERTGETKYYPRKVRPETCILAPPHAPAWVQDRQQLWNAVEKAETRKNAQVAREINIALPIELPPPQQRRLSQTFVQEVLVALGMVADLAIHRDEAHNPHVHVLLPTREISPTGFTRKNREWNHRRLLLEWRKRWAEYVNQALGAAGIEQQITHLSHRERNLPLLPTIHLGHVAHAMEKQGIISDRGQINRERLAYNALITALALERKTQVQNTDTPVPTRESAGHGRKK